MRWNDRWGEMRQVVRNRWEALTEADLGAADRAALARKVADRYGVSVREAKRQVRDFFTTLEAAVSGRLPGAKQGRRAVERTVSVIKDLRAEVLVRAAALLRRADTAGDAAAGAGEPTGSQAGDWDRREEEMAAPGGLGGHSDTEPDR